MRMTGSATFATRFSSTRHVLVLSAVTGLALAAAPTGCATDDQEGRTRTVKKTTIDTPTEKTTVTETREKSTEINPR